MNLDGHGFAACCQDRGINDTVQPLTPALSPSEGEREKPRQLWEVAADVSPLKHPPQYCRADLPHPQGERLRRGLHQCLSVSIGGFFVATAGFRFILRAAVGTTDFADNTDKDGLAVPGVFTRRVAAKEVLDHDEVHPHPCHPVIHGF